MDELKVIIAEKPSVAKNIAEAVGAKSRRDGFFEGPDYLVTWAFGHLLELLDAKEYDEKMTSWRLDNYPFIPPTFKYRVKSDSQDRKSVDEGARKQMAIIEALICRGDVTGVISATDFDREGQIIGDIILEYLNTGKPVERLLLNEWTAEEVKGGLQKLVSNTTMEPLRDAGISRQWADWSIGINLTSVATLKYQRGSGKALNIGRVLLPTLKIIYDRDKEIENFVSEEFHKLTTVFKSEDGISYEGVYQIGEVDKSIERFTDKKPLDALVAAMAGKTGKVIEKQVEQKREYPPSLFNLSNLQGYVTSKEKGWTSEKVLKVAQSLYEKKFITYPRTASLALEESLTDKAQRVLNAVKRGLPYEKEILFHTSKRVFDNSKVESHSAIMPTYVLPTNLAPDEKVVYEAVKNRFVMQFMPIAEHEEGILKTLVDIPEAYVDEACGVFVTRGRLQKVVGWKKVEKIQSKDKELPKVEVDAIVEIGKSTIESKGTAPPKRHTEKTLLKIMETCGKKFKNSKQQPAFSDQPSQDNTETDDGDSEAEQNFDQEYVDDEMLTAILSGFAIGTPATRAETISKLKSIGYIDVKGKSLFATQVGRNLVEKFPIKELFDLEYTGRLEKTLSDIGKGTITKDQFLQRIFEFIRQGVETIKKDDFHVISVIEDPKPRFEKSTEDGEQEPRESLGKCPACGSDVYEGDKSYGCSNWRSGCKFVIWKEDKFLASLKVRATKATIIHLLEVGSLTSNAFVSKKGTKFTATLNLEKNPDTGFYSWKMSF